MTNYAQEVAQILNDNRPVDSKFTKDNYVIYNNFFVKNGHKYDKVMLTTTTYYKEEYCGEYEYIELFVEKSNGNIFKPNGDQPAKNIRYNVSTQEGKEEFIKNCVNPGYLYKNKGYTILK